MRVERLRGVSFAAAGLLGATGVGMAAAAAHLGPRLAAGGQQMLRQGVEMQMWHALALLGVGAALRRADLWAGLVVAGLIGGTVGFCAGVYGLALGAGWLGRVAPIGGSVLILSWLAMALRLGFRS